VPGELKAAAAVDRCSGFGFSRRILLPLPRPALTTVAILAFITSWNAYLLALLLFNDQSHFALPLVATFQSHYSQNTAAIFAFTWLSTTIPALLFFVFAERRIVGGLTEAIKA
jgi:raffinose/stachyose/melibiose transport system permease protein